METKFYAIHFEDSKPTVPIYFDSIDISGVHYYLLNEPVLFYLKDRKDCTCRLIEGYVHYCIKNYGYKPFRLVKASRHTKPNEIEIQAKIVVDRRFLDSEFMYHEILNKGLVIQHDP